MRAGRDGYIPPYRADAPQRAFAVIRDFIEH
jgi:hypothetical protein